MAEHERRYGYRAQTYVTRKGDKGVDLAARCVSSCPLFALTDPPESLVVFHALPNESMQRRFTISYIIVMHRQAY